MSFKIGMLTVALRRNKLVYVQKREVAGIVALAEVLVDKVTSQYSLRYLDGVTTHLDRNVSNQLEPVDLVDVHTVPTRELLERYRRITFDDILFEDELLPPSLKEIIAENERHCSLA